jgi:hypothetical protein
MRNFSFAVLFLSAVSLASCTKDALFNSPADGTVLELGFAWNEAVESCLDSDDHSAAYCGSVQWLDGSRVRLDLPAPESVGHVCDDAVYDEIQAAQSIRYVYNPTSQSVTLFLDAGNVTLEWDASLGCLEGDLLDRDYLTVCAGSTPAPAP